MMRFHYFIHLLRTIPLLPIIYFQGKKIKKEIPLLPEAKDPEGIVNIGAEKNFKILFIGESSFAGVGSDFHKNSFAGHFSIYFSTLVQSNIHWKVYAKTGYNVSKIQQRIIPQIKENSCDLIVIGIGGNDTFEMTSPTQWTQNIQLLVDGLQEKFSGTPIFFPHLPTIETFPAFTNQMRFVLGSHKDILANRLTRQVLKNKNIYFPAEKIDVKAWIGKLKEDQSISDFFSDGIHPSALTYEMWAKDCVQYLKDSKINFN